MMHTCYSLWGLLQVLKQWKSHIKIVIFFILVAFKLNTWMLCVLHKNGYYIKNFNI